ncbi:ABC transporter ATP-binding protein [Ornithinimicrobium pratense]|uniref:ABC transporter ATP-binding protein n=1 Tax=Ornithinimicrobium pratense TaxID=2593973 RepID=A0A5J6V8M5_9MICO|nr:ABC transporter ATP-binding protein [Ornithinimicrobium pratense]QFG69441.1 ABC transporter ATP-binding protein [Ornithinimicrobium pratense]
MRTLEEHSTGNAADPRHSGRDLALSVRGLCKSYGSVDALRGVDLDVHRGEVLGLLGPNGAGKTTTVEILEGQRTADSGQIDVLGVDPATAGIDFRARVGVMLQYAGPPPELRVTQTVSMFASYYDNPRGGQEVLDFVGLGDMGQRRVSRLSGGQRRRLDLALAIIGRPELLFLDEPTTGFDPSARQQAWSLVESLRRLGTSVLLTTHDMDEAARLCDRIAVIVSGRVVAEGTPSQLTEHLGQRRLIVRMADRAGHHLTVDDLPDSVRGHAREVGRDIELLMDDPEAALGVLRSWSREHKHQVLDSHISRASLEDVYLALTADNDLSSKDGQS